MPGIDEDAPDAPGGVGDGRRPLRLAPTSPRFRADCSQCAALCCVVPAFAASTDFAIDKPAGLPCPHLGGDFRCGIHLELRDRGFAGCTVYDCFGAGQQVTQVTFGGHDWRSTPEVADLMGDVFPVMRYLHELLRYTSEALTWGRAEAVHDELGAAYDEVLRLTEQGPQVLAVVDVARLRSAVNALLLRASDLVRRDQPAYPVDHRGADLVGRDLRGIDLRGASLRGALLVGADLTGADLRHADLIGADLRGADLGGADLRGALFLLQSQLDSARGDSRTSLAPPLGAPGHWAASQ
jgi:uncharacterized protein YjbI with pentapeptide repeats